MTTAVCRGGLDAAGHALRAGETHDASILQVLLLSFVGLWRSTIIACILMPMGFTTVLLLSDEVSQFVALIRSTGGFVMAGFLLGNMTTVTLGRRKSFSLEYSFQAALELAVEACHPLAPPPLPPRSPDPPVA